MPLHFSKAMDLKLLELVKQNQCLYMSSHPQYADQDSREVVWQMIGDALNRPAQMCKSRWVNIRDMMRRKLRDRIRNPNQLSYQYRYEEQLAFMIPHFRETNLVPGLEYSEFEVQCEEEDYQDTARKPSKRKDDNDTINNERVSNDQRESTSNSLEVFLLSIGSTLKKFNPYYLNQAKSRIFQIVQSYELEQLDNSNKHGRVSNDVNANR